MTSKQFIELRQKLNLTQIELSEKLYITQAQISRIETGRCKVTKRMEKDLERIANEL